jgi:excisionase family DNA binding protein
MNIEKLYTKQDVAKLLNCSLSKINTLLKENKIPYFKVEKNVRFDIDDLKKWLLDKKRTD